MNKEAMFEEISRIMQEDMAPTMGCTGPISYIFSAAAARARRRDGSPPCPMPSQR